MNPDDPEKLWREIEGTVFAAPAGRNSSTYLDWLQRPLRTYAIKRYRYSIPPPPPGPPCKPTLNTINPNDGFFTNMTPATGCPDTTAGYALYRAIGPGSFRFISTINPGVTYTDAAVRHGATYRYQIFPYNGQGGYGPASDVVTLEVVDSQPPVAPTGITAEPLSQGARISWEDSTSFDTISYDLFAGTAPGGPYQKLTAQPVPIPSRTFTVSALDPNTLYYFVLRANDLAGNASSNSSEVSVITLP